MPNVVLRVLVAKSYFNVAPWSSSIHTLLFQSFSKLDKSKMPAYRNKRGLNKGKRFQGKGWRKPYCGSLYFQVCQVMSMFPQFSIIEPQATDMSQSQSRRKAQTAPLDTS